MLELGAVLLRALVFQARKPRPRLPGMHMVSPGKKRKIWRHDWHFIVGLANFARLAELLTTRGEAPLEGDVSVRGGLSSPPPPRTLIYSASNQPLTLFWFCHPPSV